MISPELLELLVCPETRQPLTVADDALVARLNGAIDARQLKNKIGQLVEKRLDGAGRGPPAGRGSGSERAGRQGGGRTRRRSSEHSTDHSAC